MAYHIPKTTVDDETREALLAAKIEVLLNRIRRCMEAHADCADDIQVREEPTTRPCPGTIYNGFSNKEPNGGIQITITLPPMPQARDR